MATDGLMDSYAKIWYHSAQGVHSHTIPTRPLNTTGLGDPGDYENWNGGTSPADAMVEGLMDKLAEVVPSTTVYDKYTLYKWNPTTEIFNPVYEAAYPVTGSAVGLTGQAAAVQVTVSFRTLGFGILKLVLLDRPNNNTWGNQYTMPADYTEVVAEITNPDLAWSGRDNFRPFNFTNVTISLNKRLRRKYGMI
jgi:hypothetical protein